MFKQVNKKKLYKLNLFAIRTPANSFMKASFIRFSFGWKCFWAAASFPPRLIIATSNVGLHYHIQLFELMSQLLPVDLALGHFGLVSVNFLSILPWNITYIIVQNI